MASALTSILPLGKTMKASGIIVLIFCLCCNINAVAQTDSLYNLLDTLAVTGKRIDIEIKGNVANTLNWDMDMMHGLPKILGNADPMRYTQLLPGIQTCSEYDSGIHIQGCDNSHNFVGIEGVPVYNASHLLGLFSTFNASHFQSMDISKNPFKASHPNRIGGILEMRLHDNIHTNVNGGLEIGPLSSQGTLHSPLGKNSSITLSARRAYLNLLYGSMLKIDGSSLKYGFSDYNFTFQSRFKKNTRLILNAYYGNDNSSMEEEHNSDGIRLKWGNALVSATLRHDFSNVSSISHSIYYTGYRNRLQWKVTGISMSLPSRIQSVGYKSGWKQRFLSIGIEGALHFIEPQTPNTSTDNTATDVTFRAQEHTFYLDYSRSVSNWVLSIGARGSLYMSDDTPNYAAFDPTVGIEYNISGNSRIAINYGWRHQYLHRVGFSDIGLPTEFWIHSNYGRKPQYTQGVVAMYETGLFNNRYNLTVEFYYKRLYNQIEYKGNVLDFLNKEYTLESQLLKGKGRNYGMNIMLSKQTGRLTGWASYSLGRALRTFDSHIANGTFPASHERIHEANMLITYHINDKWDIGGTLIAASGTPFTAPKTFYLVAGSIVTEYGEHNGNRLSPYIRFDLSANYYIINDGKRESGFNLSVYNVTARRNNIFYRMKIYENNFAYMPVNFLLRVMPSISYFYRF